MTTLQWVERSLEGFPYWEVQGRECVIVIEPRPVYCDRGNFKAIVDARGELAHDMDGQDGWPRYYFDIERAKLEIEAWLRKRNQLPECPRVGMTEEEIEAGITEVGGTCANQD